MYNENEEITALDYWYEEILSNYSEEEAAEIFDGLDN